MAITDLANPLLEGKMHLLFEFHYDNFLAIRIKMVASSELPYRQSMEATDGKGRVAAIGGRNQ